MRNRIAQKLLLYFIIPLCIFAVMSGILFQTLFTRDITADAEEELLSRAAALADTLSEGRGQRGARPQAQTPAWAGVQAAGRARGRARG